MKLPLQAGPYALNVRWKREERPAGRRNIRFYRRELEWRGSIDLDILSPLAAFSPPDTSAFVLPQEWSAESIEGGGFRILFWCGDTGNYALELRVGKDFRQAELRALASHSSHAHLGFLLTSPVRWLVLHRLTLDGGLLLHGAGILSPTERGLVATGPSGAGKSTLSRIFRKAGGSLVFCDETLAMLPGPEGWTFWGTPWHGMLRNARNRGHGIRHLFFLEKTSAHECRSIGKREAFSRIFSEVFVPPAHTALAEMAVENLQRLLQAHHPAILGFKKSVSVVPFVEKLP